MTMHVPVIFAAADMSLLTDLALVAMAAVMTALILARLRLPVITGLLLSGALIGPSGFALIAHSETGTIEILSEIGLILLLFTIGLEFSLKKLTQAWRLVLIGGSLQVLLTVAAVTAIALGLGMPVEVAIITGCILALSSTAIVLRGLSERGEFDAPHGQFIVGVLIFQDLCVVPMMLLIPILAGQTADSPAVALAKAAAMTVAVVVAVILGAKLLIPRLFRIVDATRSREVFVLTVMATCTGTAWLTAQLGLSLELGAFLAGMVLADTDFGNRAIGDIIPLRDVLSSIFFVSLGMLFNVGVFQTEPVEVAMLLAALVVGKLAIAILAAMAMRFPARVAWLAGVGLAQMGEFGFVLTQMAERAQLVQPGDFDALLAAAVMSMFLTPLLIRMGPHVRAGERILRPLERLIGARGVDEIPKEHDALSHHTVVVGYGVGGRLLCQALREAGQKYLVLELNADTVRKARDGGENIYYGDITSAEAMHHAGLERAQALVLMINDPYAARRAVTAARHFAPHVPILLRARYMSSRETLVQLGVSDVVFEEVEAGAEMLARVLRRLKLPGNAVRKALLEARKLTDPSERQPSPVRFDTVPELADVRADTFRVTDKSFANGKNLLDLELRSRTGATVLALRREGRLISNLDPHEPFMPGDLVVIVGADQSIVQADFLMERGQLPKVTTLFRRDDPQMAAIVQAPEANSERPAHVPAPPVAQSDEFGASESSEDGEVNTEPDSSNPSAPVGETPNGDNSDKLR